MSVANAIFNGARLRCPACGQGRLFRAYLKPVDLCASCGERLGHIRADDGPAWLAILIVGHVVLGALFATEMRLGWPLWLSISVWSFSAIVLTLLLLPVCKGIFIGALWAMQAPGSEIE
ncbi:MAG: DUF983 domain-containing protein [Alphaproteobacteria bacterium]|nr:DUF983 domain-containing protein [Alphaproteobacteria bacterium]